MCIERFLGVKLWQGWNRVSRERKWLLGLSIAAAICFGFGFFVSMEYMIAYHVDYKSLSVWFGSVEGFEHYAAVWAGVMACWLLGLVRGIRQMWRINACGGGKRGWVALGASALLLAVLIFATRTSDGYVYGFLREKMRIRYCEQHGAHATEVLFDLFY